MTASENVYPKSSSTVGDAYRVTVLMCSLRRIGGEEGRLSACVDFGSDSSFRGVNADAERGRHNYNHIRRWDSQVWNDADMVYNGVPREE